MSHRFSAIDIGSNAIRMIIGETFEGRLRSLKKFRAPIRLGHDVFTQGEVSNKTMADSEAAFRDFSSLNKKFGVEKCRAVATSALREAKNRLVFVEKMNRVSQIDVEVIDGIKEAELIFLAVKKEVNLSKKSAVLVDIGGGSVEITIAVDEKLIATQSFPLGTVRLLENLKRRNLNESHLNVVLGDFVGPLVQYLEKHAKGQSFDFAVGTGGNLDAMARLKIQLLQKTPNTFLSLPDIVQLTQVLRQHSIRERIETLQLRPDRADVIVPAIMVVKTILRQAGIEKILIPAVGLRDGLLWSVSGLT